MDWNFVKSIEAIHFKNQAFRCLVLGNSLAMDGIDTELLTEKGISAYNLAIGGASLKANYIQLSEYIKSNQNPEIVLLGLSSCFDIDINSETINPIIDYSYGLSKYSIRDLPLWKYKWIGKELLKKIVSKDHRTATLKAGQLKFARVVSDKSEYKELVKHTIDSIKYQNATFLLRMDSLCNHHQIKLIILEMPGIKKKQNEIAIESIVYNEANDVPVKIFNLNNRQFCTLFNDERDWLGNCHLNVYGAKKLTEYIYERILSRKSN